MVLAVVVFITGCFSYYQNAKSDDLMKSFASMSPPKVPIPIPSLLFNTDKIRKEGVLVIHGKCMLIIKAFVTKCTIIFTYNSDI